MLISRILSCWNSADNFLSALLTSKWIYGIHTTRGGFWIDTAAHKIIKVVVPRGVTWSLRRFIENMWNNSDIRATLYSARENFRIEITHSHSLTHALPGVTTHAGSWPTQEVASNHLYPWPCSSNFWLPASLHPSSLHPSIWGLAFPLAFFPPACPRWFS